VNSCCECRTDVITVDHTAPVGAHWACLHAYCHAAAPLPSARRAPAQRWSTAHNLPRSATVAVQSHVTHDVPAALSWRVPTHFAFH
jgi:hypothetical protein